MTKAKHTVGATKRAKNNDHIRHLIQRVGHKRAGELLGVSIASLRKWEHNAYLAPFMSVAAVKHHLGPENGAPPELLVVLPTSPSQTAAYKKIFEDAGVPYFRPLNK